MDESPLPGPLMVDVAAFALDAGERARLCHPAVGGVIFFSRNYQSPQQLQALAAEIHALRPELLIAVDHEGGRVQRFREGFTRLPAMSRLGEVYDQSAKQASMLAEAVGFILAAELKAHGVDLSFTPVLDLDWRRSGVIGDRAFHGNPYVVAELANALIRGLNRAGMPGCGKHFPGHGWVEADSHEAIPVDERSWNNLQADLIPFRKTPLAAVMPAHVVYPNIDCRSAGFSPVWIGLLRDQLKFDGVIFSDDLTMQGAATAGGIVDRVEAAWNAGCDMLLICNHPELVDEVLSDWQFVPDAKRSARIAGLLQPGIFTGREGFDGLADCLPYRQALAECHAAGLVEWTVK